VILSPRKCNSPAWPLAGFFDVTGNTLKGAGGEKGVTVLEGMVGRARFWKRRIKKKVAENSKLKMITGERAIGGTWY